VIYGKKLIVVMPAYNAERTLQQTIAEIPREYVDDIVLVDDGSHDATVTLARSLGLHTIVHPHTRATAATRTPATPRRWNWAPTSSSWCIRTTSTRRAWW
jgi:cellulose synthase/poly-beta-1,6-N-acetylglucosamine synthase-like glycosyltransferase